jgi:hypothetical protein
MQCSVYIRIQDGGDHTHGKIIARASPYRKCGVGADFLTETRRTQRTVIRLRSSDSYLCTRHRGPAAFRHSSFCIQHSKLPPPPRASVPPGDLSAHVAIQSARLSRAMLVSRLWSQRCLPPSIRFFRQRARG